ncbi:cache domain-containing protein [Candidatus Pacearchaeota archaeon]|nr:cache domain-containing protein [Candidatus Pacearchaeota archaeon]
MNFLSILILIYVIFSFIGFGSLLIYNVSYGNDAIRVQTLNHLKDIAYSKADRINLFLDERKADVIFLAASENVQNAFGEDGKVTIELDRDMRLFQKSKGYNDLILINTQGDVIWVAKEDGELGIDSHIVSCKDVGLVEVYRKTKKDLQIEVIGPIYCDDHNMSEIFITSPVFDIDDVTNKRNLIGIVALEINRKQIEKLVTMGIMVEDIGEIYIVDSDNNYITPLKNNFEDSSSYNKEAHFYKVYSEGIDACFEDYNYYFERHGGKIEGIDKSGIYKNYYGIPVLGAYEYISEFGWCVLVEINEEEFFRPINAENIFLLYVFLGGLVFIFIVSLIIDSYFYVKKNRGYNL